MFLPHCGHCKLNLFFLLHMLFFLALASQNYGRQAKGIKIFLKLHENFFLLFGREHTKYLTWRLG